ncbi:MAG: hypothetical protein H8K10_17110 [Nitrospira sp.]|nr:hypothetical protein [Nitrospira sp.]
MIDSRQEGIGHLSTLALKIGQLLERGARHAARRRDSRITLWCLALW